MEPPAELFNDGRHFVNAAHCLNALPGSLYVFVLLVIFEMMGDSMIDISRWAILAWLLTLFFVVGGVVNLVAPPAIAQQYRKWGYPDWFHAITGGLEIIAAILLAIMPTRVLGAALGGVVMLAAVITVIINGEHKRALLPAIVLLLLAATGWMAVEV
jgi:uncharacterized membrane protein YphA (DoxX/SURF4 family)